jgi:hypothetical protein
MARRRSDDDFRHEIEAHIALEADRLIAEGVSPDEARHRAARTLGNVTAARERFYESRRVCAGSTSWGRTSATPAARFDARRASRPSPS